MQDINEYAEPVLVALLTDADHKVRRTGAAAAGLWATGNAAIRDYQPCRQVRAETFTCFAARREP